MAIFYSRGDELVTEAELDQAHAREVTPFAPIGIGKPLAIEIRHVYTGEYPRSRRIFQTGLLPDRSRDMLVTSAIRCGASTGIAPRAVNILEEDIQPHADWNSPSAARRGTRLVWYTPALTDRQTDLCIEMGFDEFSEEVFHNIGNKMEQAAGIPAFASASLYLMAAGHASKLWARIAQRLFDEPQIRFEETVAFESPGTISATEGLALVTPKGAQVDSGWLKEHKLKNGQLVEKRNDRPYRGDLPYVVISLDGTKRDDYAKFAPAAAAAGLIEQFYGETSDADRQGVSERSLAMLQTAMLLYNDVQFRVKADDANAELTALRQRGASPEEVERKRIEVDAFIANISTEVLKPYSHAVTAQRGHAA